MGSRVSGNEPKPSGHTWPLTVPCGPLLQVLALCHIAVGQQMSLHWLHKVRPPPWGWEEGDAAAGPAAGEECGRAIPAPGRRPSSLWITTTVVPAATQVLAPHLLSYAGLC